MWCSYIVYSIKPYVIGNPICLSHTASSDYTSVVSEELRFTSGQVTTDMQCVSISILDDVNVLEVEVESFEVMLTSLDSAVTFPLGQENATVNINEDVHDGRYPNVT